MAEERLNEEENTRALEEGDENVILWVTLGISYAIDVFATEIEREIAILRNAGIGNQGIADTIRNDLLTNGRVFGKFSNNIKRGIVSGVMQANRIGQSEVYGDSVNFRWVSVGAPKICVDCQERIGEVATLDQWEAIGLPATGFSVCKEFCYCQLVEESVEIDDKVILD